MTYQHSSFQGVITLEARRPCANVILRVCVCVCVYLCTCVYIKTSKINTIFIKRTKLYCN